MTSEAALLVNGQMRIKEKESGASFRSRTSLLHSYFPLETATDIQGFASVENIC